ncbi:MAG: ABC transporter permease [Thermoplasmata archaeon]|nr:ABC transporter permease [Thermoplasmata archaeon]
MMLNEIKNVVTILELEARRLRHDYSDIIIRSVQPILWLVVFGSVFTNYRVIPTGEYSYLEFVAPGILGQSVLFVSIFFGLMLVWDRESGNLSKLLVSPTSRYTIVLGKSLSAGIRSIAQGAVVILLILLIGIRFRTSPLLVFLVFPAIVLIAAVSAGISIFFTSLLKTRERVMGIGQVLTMPLFFTSNALYPISMMPSWLQWIAHANPITYGIDILRSFMLTGDLSGIPLDLAVLGGYLLVLTLVNGKLLQRIME